MTAFERIRDAHVPLWLKRFQESAADYNSDGELPFEPHTVLGIKGQFADIWRKIWKLKKALWDGAELIGEQPIEIIDDLIAHLFLTRDMLATPYTPKPKRMAEKTEGPALLGVNPDEWERLKALANSIHSTGKPEALESQGYYVFTRDPVVGMVCEFCRWDRMPEEGMQHFHAYIGSCKYRIRRRRQA